MRFILFTLTLFISSAASAEAVKYRSDIKPLHYNDVWKRQTEATTRIDYDSETKKFYLYISESITLSGFSLDQVQADAVIAAIDKYNKWNKKASTKKVTLQKVITTVPTGMVFWKMGDGDWNFAEGAPLTISFFSQSVSTHQLVIEFPKVTDRTNPYLTHQMETIYFSYKEANRFKEAFLPSSIEKFLKKAK